MKKFLAILLTVVLLVSSSTVYTAAYADNPNPDFDIDGRIIVPDGYVFLTDDTCGLLYYDGTETSVTVGRLPSYRLPVTTVFENAFRGNQTLESVRLTDDVTTVEAYAFSDCTALRTVEIPPSVTFIGEGAFDGCGDELLLYVAGGSAAEIYAMEHGISYTVKDIRNCDIQITYQHDRVTISSISVTDDGKTLRSGTDYTFAQEVDWDGMVSEITVSGIGMYSGVYSEASDFEAVYSLGYWTVELEKDSYVYDGKEKRPSVTVYYECQPEGHVDPDAEYEGDDDPFGLNRVNPVGAQAASDATAASGYKIYLTEGRDYTLSYSDNVNAGTATVTLNGKGLYMDSVSKTFTITRKTLSNTAVTLSPSVYTYDGTAKHPAVTVTVEGRTLTENTDYTVVYSNDTNAGNGSVLVFGAGNYTGTVSRAYSIGKRDINDADIGLETDAYIYDGTAKSPAVSASFNGTLLAQGTDYTVSYSNNTAVGEATVTVSGSGSFTGSQTLHFSIQRGIRPISVCEVTLSDYSYTYDGSAKYPSVTVKDGSTLLRENTDYTVTYIASANAGYSTVRVSGMGSYSGSTEKQYYIATKGLSASMLQSGAQSFLYDGTEKQCEVVLKDGSKTLTENVDYTVRYTNNVKAGTDTAKAVVTGIGNYSGSFIKTFSIRPRSASGCTVSLSDSAFEYDGSEKCPDVTVEFNGTVLKKGKDYTLSYADNIEPGRASVTVSGIGNFNGSRTVIFTIEPQSASTLQVTLAGSYYYYIGEAIKPAVTVKSGSTVLTQGDDYTLRYSDCTNAGEASVEVTGTGRYKGSKTLKYTIAARAVKNAHIVLSPKTLVYNGTERKPTVTLTDLGNTLVQNRDYRVTFQSNIAPGNAYAVIEGLGNYCGTATESFTVTAPADSSFGTFTWGTDNWNFNNSSTYFTKKYYTDPEIEALFAKDLGLGSDVISYIDKSTESKNNSKGFNGSCYGITTTEMLAKKGYLDLSAYGLNPTVNRNTNSRAAISMINCFQFTYGRSDVSAAARRQMYHASSFTQSDYIDKLDSYLSGGGKMMNLCFAIQGIYTDDYTDSNKVEHKKGEYEGYGGHSILAYGIESCSYSSAITGLTYNRRILIADPNMLTVNKLSTEYCVYYRTSDHSWLIPHYNKKVKTYFNTLCYWNAFGTEGKKTGYIYGLYDYDFRLSGLHTTNLMGEDDETRYIAGLSIDNAGGSAPTVEVISDGNPNLAYTSDGADNGVRAYDTANYTEDGEAPQTESYALWNATADYSVSFSGSPDTSMVMDYRKTGYSVDLSSATRATFSPSGTVTATGRSTDYSLSMVSHDDVSVTDWNCLTVSGSGVNEVSLTKALEGYVLKASNFDQVSVSANNSIADASCSFSVNADSVYIYEVNALTIGVRADTDGDGVYDTEVDVSGNQPKYQYGDVNRDGAVDIVDATQIQEYSAALVEFDMVQMVLGDLNGDGRVDVSDATYVQRLALGLL